MRNMKAMAVALALPLSACALAQPTTVAEWREVDRVQSMRPNWPDPPVNLTLEGHRRLFRDAVFVGRMRVWADVEVMFYGRDGRFLRCNANEDGHYWKEAVWRPIVVARRNGATPLLDLRADAPERKVHLSYLYDGHTGELTEFTEWRRRWWDWGRGHLQRRLPAAVWELCPTFPPAEELGVGVNHAQTAALYHELVAQHPGERILLPDLMESDPIRLYE